MKTISIKTYLLLLSLGIVVGIGAVIFFVVLPNVQKISVVSARLDAQGVTRAITTGASRRETTDTQIIDTETRVIALEKKLLSTSSVLETITTFEALAEKHAIIQKIDVISATSDAYTLSLGMVGSMNNILAYLADMQTLPYAVIAPSITWDRRAINQTPVAGGAIAAHTIITIYVAHPDHQ